MAQNEFFQIRSDVFSILSQIKTIIIDYFSFFLSFGAMYGQRTEKIAIKSKMQDAGLLKNISMSPLEKLTALRKFVSRVDPSTYARINGVDGIPA